jgi:hypothetical protein
VISIKCPLDSPQQPRFVLALQFVLPNPQHQPSGFSQLTVDDQSSPAIGSDLPPPESAVAFRFPVAARAAVPETTINKYSHSQFQKDEIRPSMNPIPSPPPSNA